MNSQLVPSTIIINSFCCYDSDKENGSPAVAGATDVEENDVLWGRNKIAHAHAGNVTFRRLIREYREEYQSTRIRENKANVVRTIIAAIVNAGGRFLKSTGDEGDVWVEASSTQTYDKVSHALRSAKPIKGSNITKKRCLPTLEKITAADATYERLFARQMALLAAFKGSDSSIQLEKEQQQKQQQQQQQQQLAPQKKTLQTLDALPRCCSMEASPDFLADLDNFLGGTVTV